MKSKKTIASKKNEILFQKMGNTWFVFAEIEGEMLYSPLPEGVNPHSTKLELFEVIEKQMEKISRTYINKHKEIAA